MVSECRVQIQLAILRFGGEIKEKEEEEEEEEREREWEQEGEAALAATPAPADLRPGRCRYKVAVFTSNRWWAGTDANITLTLKGPSGEMTRKLKHDSESMWTDKFERNQVDTFFFEDVEAAAVDADTGEWMLDQVTVSSDGRGAGADWHLDHIAVTNVTAKGAEVKFDCRNWFSRKKLSCSWRRDGDEFPHDVGFPSEAEARPLAFSRVPGTWGDHRYKIVFHTHKGWWAGTDARVGITLQGGVAVQVGDRLTHMD